MYIIVRTKPLSTRVTVLGGTECHVVDEEYRKVVVHVQDGELFLCLAKDNEDRVTKIEHHWQIEEIQHIAHDGGIGFEDIA